MGGRSVRELTYGSLFSGVGGFDEGFRQAGYRCLWACEIDEAAAGVFAYHHPGVPLYADVIKLDPAKLETPDVIIYGFPCTDLSVAGKRAGLKGARSGLFYEATRIIRVIRPRFAIAENVPGLRSSHEGADFYAVLAELAELGTDCAWATLDSQYFGVPQRRDRVFIVLDLGGESAQEILALTESLRGDFEESGKERSEIAGAIGASLGGSDVRHAQAGHIAISAEGAPGIHLNRSNLGKMQHNQAPLIIGALQNNGKAAGSATLQDAECGLLIPFDPNQITSQTNRSQPRPGDPMHPIPAQPQAPLIAFHSTGNGEGCAEEMSPSPRTVDPVAVAHGASVRRLTPLEGERCMGWPDGHTATRTKLVKTIHNEWISVQVHEHQSDSARYRQIGNGVVAPIAKWLADQAKNVLNATPPQPTTNPP